MPRRPRRKAIDRPPYGPELDILLMLWDRGKLVVVDDIVRDRLLKRGYIRYDRWNSTNTYRIMSLTMLGQKYADKVFGLRVKENEQAKTA